MFFESVPIYRFYILKNSIAITINPSTTLYIANTLKLPFCKYLSKNLITNIPTIKLASTPTKNGTPNTKSFILTSAAAATTGVDNKNENFAIASLFIPIFLPTVIVIPDLDTPGNAAANACDIEISNACLNVICFISYFDLDFLSTT